MFNNGDGTWTGYYSAGGGTCTNATLQQACAAMSGFHWNAWNQTCEPNETECPANQVTDATTGSCKDACPLGMVVNPQGQCEEEKDSCAAGQIKSPQGGCLPGEGQCAAGEAKRPDGTCGKDANGDGVADDDDEDPDNDSEKNTFSGGENCDVPPSCTGDPVMCGQSRIQWRIDCNTRKNRSISGGGCGATPICTGKNCDAMEYAQLQMQWRTACAVEKGFTGDGSGGEDGETIKPDFEALAPGGDGDDGQGSIFLPADGEVSLNDSKLSYGGGINPVLAEADGQQFRIPQAVIDWLSVLRFLIIALATLAAIGIIRGS